MKLYFIHIFCNKMNYEHILFKMKKIFKLFRHDATISKSEPDTVNLHFNLTIFIDNDEYIFRNSNNLHYNKKILFYMIILIKKIILIANWNIFLFIHD